MKESWVVKNCQCDCDYLEEDPEAWELEFVCCSSCDLSDACSDFGCAVEQGLKEPETY
jgi:hypothetical protein